MASVALFVAGFLSASPARAQVRSRWSLPPGCPSALDAAAGAEASLAAAPEARLDVEVTPQGSGFVAALELTGAVAAQRRLSDPDCAALVDAVIVIAALALGLDAPAPGRGVDGAPAASSSPAGPPASAEEPPPRAAEPARAPQARRAAGRAAASDAGASTEPAWALRVALGASLETSLASVPLAASLAVGLAYEALRVEVAGHAWPAMDVARGEAQGAALWAALGALRVGGGGFVAIADAGRLELVGGARLEVGVLHGEGYGVATPERGGAPLVALGADGALTYWPVAWLGVELRAGVTVPLTRPRFLLDGAPVFRPDPAGLRVGLGVRASFGRNS